MYGPTLLEPVTPDPVNVVTNSDSTDYAIGMNDNGQYAVAWWTIIDGKRHILVVPYNPDGTPRSAPVEVNVSVLSTSWTRISVAMDADGNFVVAWEPSGAGAMFQRFNVDGVKQGSAVTITVTGANIDYVDVAMEPDGDFLVAYRFDNLIAARRYSANGSAIGSTLNLVSPASSTKKDMAVDVASSGEFVLYWQDPNNNLWVARYSASGVPLSAPYYLSTGVDAANLDMASSGEFAVTYFQAGNVIVRRFDSGGTELIGPFFVGTTDYGYIDTPSVAVTDNGLLVAWRASMSGRVRAFARRFNVDGLPEGPLTEVSGAAAVIDSVVMAADANGDAVIIWETGSGSSYPLLSRAYRTRVVAEANGPYEIVEGDPLALDGIGSLDLGGDVVSVEWDLNGDNNFSDATGLTPVVPWSQLQLLGLSAGTHNVTARVRDQFGVAAISASTTLTILPGRPIAAIGPMSGRRGESVSTTLSATYPPGVNPSAPFTFDIDWDGDGLFDESVVGPSGTSVSHVFNQAGTIPVRVRATGSNGVVGPSDQSSAAIIGHEVLAGQLVWYGSTGDDEVAFEPIDASTARILLHRVNGNVVSETFTAGGVTGVTAIGRAGGDRLDGSLLSLPLWLQGQEGSDTLVGGLDANTIWGGQGDDDIQGGPGNDILFGEHPEGEGRSLAQADLGNDTIAGGDGLDTIYGDGDGGEGANDVLFGNDGDDVIIGDGNAGGGNDTIDGGRNDDTIFGDADANSRADGSEGGADSILGGEGLDAIESGGGSDLVDAGSGDDIVLGGDGAEGSADTLLGGDGRDVIVGDGGTLTFVVKSAGADSIDGGTGEDLIVAGFFQPLNYAAYGLILAEWTSERTFAERVANVSGTGVGPRNNGDFSLIPGINVFNDKTASSTAPVIDTILADDAEPDWIFLDFEEDNDTTNVGDELVDLAGIPYLP